MAPIHVTRKFWWELIFIGVLIFLFTGIRSQMKRDLLAIVVPHIKLEVRVGPPHIPLALN